MANVLTGDKSVTSTVRTWKPVILNVELPEHQLSCNSECSTMASD